MSAEAGDQVVAEGGLAEVLGWLHAIVGEKVSVSVGPGWDASPEADVAADLEPAPLVALMEGQFVGIVETQDEMFAGAVALRIGGSFASSEPNVVLIRDDVAATRHADGTLSLLTEQVGIQIQRLSG